MPTTTACTCGCACHKSKIPTLPVTADMVRPGDILGARSPGRFIRILSVETEEWVRTSHKVGAKPKVQRTFRKHFRVAHLASGNLATYVLGTNEAFQRVTPAGVAAMKKDGTLGQYA